MATRRLNRYARPHKFAGNLLDTGRTRKRLEPQPTSRFTDIVQLPMSTHSHNPADFDPHHQACCGVSTNLEDYFLTRRKFLSRVGMGLGALSLANIIDPSNLVGATAKGKVAAGPLDRKSTRLNSSHLV